MAAAAPALSDRVMEAERVKLLRKYESVRSLVPHESENL